MGIPGFQKWLVGTFPEAVTRRSTKAVDVFDHVAFDMSQIIHQTARRSPDKETLALLVFREMDKILKNCVPKRSVFLAFDGPGPLAKLLTQRKRRCKEKKPSEKLIKYGRGRSRGVKTPLDRLQFTPGVELLYYLRDSILYWTHCRLQNDRKYQNIDFFISGPDVAGEGELKIVDFCRSRYINQGESLVVIGGDADIVLQGLTTTTLQNFLVFLPPSGQKKAKVNSYVSVWELCRSFERLFPGETSGVRLDFVVLSMLQGNDYLPKVRGISLPRLWRRYIKLKAKRRGTHSEPPFAGQYVIDADTRTFNWAFLYAIMQHTGHNISDLPGAQNQNGISKSVSEEGADANGVIRPLLHTTDTEIDSCDDVVLYTGDENGVFLDSSEDSDMAEDASDEGGENGDVEWDSDETDDEDSFDDIDEDEAHIENLVAISGTATKHYDTEQYLRTLLWTLQMYIDGYCSDYSYSYGKPYAPSCNVIRKFIEDNAGDPFAVHAPVSNLPALLPHQAAMAMLPVSAAKFLPKPMQDIVANPTLSREIFLSRHKINVPAMLDAIEKVPISAYSAEELRRMKFGVPVQIRLPRGQDRRPPPRKPYYKPPGPRFAPLRTYPVLYMTTFAMTAAPPCLPWPKGGVAHLLSMRYKRVGGSQQLASSRKPQDKGGSNGRAPERKGNLSGNASRTGGERRRPAGGPGRRTNGPPHNSQRKQADGGELK